MSCSGGHSHGCGDHSHEFENSHDTSSDIQNGPLESGFASAHQALDQIMNAASSDSLDMEWSRAEALFHHIENEDSSFECDEHDIGKHCVEALAAFMKCSKMIREADLYPSSNEIVEEIETENLKYLLVNFYIGKLQQMDTGNAAGPARRLENIKSARLSFENFVELVCRIGVILPNERDSLGFAQLLDQGKGESEDNSDRSNRHRSMDPNAMRMAKIERFRRNQAAKKRLAQIADTSAREALRRRAAIKRGFVESEITDGVGSVTGGVGGALDPETRREQLLLALETSAREAVDEAFAIDEVRFVAII